MVSVAYVQSIICSQTQLDGTAHEQTIICRQLFAGHVVGFWPMKRKKNLHQMIIIIIGLPVAKPNLKMGFVFCSTKRQNGGQMK
ncbi:MAG: hypothetical protein MI923_23425 [Phycisphaerales bacterium]|nr:hypothetical protein [Phycisphaerales bacterium]